jgi:hypothetical protein
MNDPSAKTPREAFFIPLVLRRSDRSTTGARLYSGDVSRQL